MKVLTAAEMRAVDQRTIEGGLSGPLLMENAGRGVADCLGRLGSGGPVTICCGPGNNGGDGYVIARHLDLRGQAVRVLVWCSPDRIQGDAAINYRILKASGVPLEHLGDAADLAARLAGSAWVVGCVADQNANPQCPDAILASAVIRIDQAFSHILDRFEPGVLRESLNSGTCVLVLNPRLVGSAIPPAMQAELETAGKRLVAGEIAIPK